MNDGTPPAEVATPGEPANGERRRFVQRWVRRALALVVAVVATVLVSFFSIDLGRFPQVRRAAEEQATRYLERGMTIGRISALVTPGSFILDDVVIAGRNPGDRPFMRIGRIYLHVPWWTIFRGELHVDLTLDDWEMVVETWPGNIHNVPRLKPRGGSNRGPLPFTTTVDFVHARGGRFTYDDHATPWGVVAPNLSFSLVRGLGQYLGRVGFSDGSVQIQSYRPMQTSMSARFALNGPAVDLNHIDLVTEGTTSHVSGAINFDNWPEQTYNVNSVIDFAPMKEIFFANETWTLGGEGGFTGVFHLPKAGGFQLAGDFTSAAARVSALDFLNLHGSLIWEPTRFAVTHADADMLGGHTRFTYSLAPLRSPDGTTATFSADYDGLDLFDLDRLMGLRGLRLAGAAAGSVSMQWRNGRFASTRRGEGYTFVEAPEGVRLASVDLPAEPIPAVPEPRPFDSLRRPGPLTIGADVHYTFDPSGVSFDEGWAATTHSFVSFAGRMASDGSSQFPFHVTSHDWQESDRLLSGIMTSLSGPTGAVEVGGRGTFDGVMTGSFSAPRIEGRFEGESLRVWDVTWGRARADLVIQNGYVDISSSRIGDETSFIVADGRFALGFRKDEAEEINARVKLVNWPMVDLRHAFQLDDWPMEGTMGEADLTLTGRYRTMFGSGRLRVDQGSAWGESFDVATADVELEGTGMRVSRIEMRKGPGLMHGAARIGWDGTYAFNADGENVAVETLDNFRIEQAPMSGRLKFKASGASEFEVPTYTFDASIDDLFVGDEGIGSVTGRVTVTNDVMTIERFLAASSRLQVFGTGTIALDDASTADLRLRFQETALDPYLKFVLAEEVSPYARMVIGGSLSVRGPLATPLDLAVETSIDDAALTLYDYDLLNDGPILIRFVDGVLSVDALTLRGTSTNLSVSGGADMRQRTWDMSASGDAGLAILQLMFQNITTSGAATLNARLTGSFEAPRLTGEASIVDGRLRPFSSPHSLESLNGRILFEANAVNVDGLSGRIGSGEVEFGGSISLDGYALAEYNLTTTGRSMRLRYPSGFISTVDMDLVLNGPSDQPTLSGTIDVLRMMPAGTTDPGAGWFSFAAAGGTGMVTVAPTGGSTAAPAVPLALDIRVTAPMMSFIDTSTARIEGTANLRVRGTFDTPIINGNVEIAGGELNVSGNRFFVREGSIDFNDASGEPEFNLSADARPRVAGQVYTVNVQLRGTFRSFTWELSSDPWLPESDVISLLLGASPDLLTAEQRALGSSQELQQRMLQTFGAALLASPITSRLGDVVERTGAFDTVQIVPVLTNEFAFQQLNPSARITLGKRISPRVFLTYSRTLSGIEDEIILLEYDQSDRISWVLSRNEDRTFALDFRIRYVF